MRSHLGRWSVTFAEAAVLLTVGIYLYRQPELKTLGEISLAISFIVIVNRIAIQVDYSSALTKAFAPLIESSAATLTAIQKIREIIDLSEKSNVQHINRLLHAYLAVRAEKLTAEKDRIVGSAILSLERLAANLKTPVLEEPQFYEWLFRAFDDAVPGTNISIVSMGEDYEWTDTPQEQKFFEKNVNAAKRGAKITRVFCFTKDRVSEAAKNKFIYEHRQGNRSGLIGRMVDRDTFQKIAPTAMSQAGQGFIIVNEEFVMIDVFSPDGKARGQVLFNPAEVQSYWETYQHFERLSKPLKFPAGS